MSQPKNPFPLPKKKVTINNIVFEIRGLTFKEAMGIGALMSTPNTNALNIAQIVVHLGTVFPREDLEQLPYQDYIKLMNAILELSGFVPSSPQIVNPSRRTNP